MNGRSAWTIQMELRSDTVFGSGFSIPGGADLSSRCDALGYPSVSGATFKGLLRESLENLLAWSGQPETLAEELLGKGGWAGLESPRRVQLTGLTLVQPPEDPERCYHDRTFTQLENGVVKSRSLRMAHCVSRGLVFTGTLYCKDADADLLKEAVQGIRFVGTQRSRGLGHVRCTMEPAAAANVPTETLPEGTVIRYRLRNLLPVIITDLTRSHTNGFAARDYIPGSSISGMVLSALSQQQPEWFAAHKAALLGGGVQFCDAIPCPSDWEPLPPIMGFYGPKDSDTVISVLQKDVAGKKRVAMGTCCQLQGDTIHTWSGITGGSMRIARQKPEQPDALPFQVQYLEAGQNFTGYIRLEDPSMAPMIAGVLQELVWLGADRGSGFGQCRVEECRVQEQPGWYQYGYGPNDAIGTELYLLALSPLGLCDQWGEPCGLTESFLSDKLGVSVESIVACSTALKEFSGFNRTWQCRVQHQRMYDRGSIFRLRCASVPNRERLEAIQREGLGIRPMEGFGQVLFLRPELLTQIRKKQAEEPAVAAVSQTVAQRRRARYQWIMDHRAQVHSWDLSASQLGTLQDMCRQGEAVLMEYLQRSLKERGAAHGARYKKAANDIAKLLEHPVLGCSRGEMLPLLDQLIDHSRKEKGGKRQ